MDFHTIQTVIAVVSGLVFLACLGIFALLALLVVLGGFAGVFLVMRGVIFGVKASRKAGRKAGHKAGRKPTGRSGWQPARNAAVDDTRRFISGHMADFIRF